MSQQILDSPKLQPDVKIRYRIFNQCDVLNKHLSQDIKYYKAGELQR